MMKKHAFEGIKPPYSEMIPEQGGFDPNDPYFQEAWAQRTRNPSGVTSASNDPEFVQGIADGMRRHDNNAKGYYPTDYAAVTSQSYGGASEGQGVPGHLLPPDTVLEDMEKAAAAEKRLQEGYARIRAQQQAAQDAMKQRYHEEYVKRIDPPIQSAVAPWDLFGPAVLIGGRRAYHAAPHLLPTSVTRRISSLADDVGDAAAIHGQAALNHASRYADDAWKGAQSIGRQVGDMADDAVLGGRLAFQDGKAMVKKYGVPGSIASAPVILEELKDAASWAKGKLYDAAYDYVGELYDDLFDEDEIDHNTQIEMSD